MTLWKRRLWDKSIQHEKPPWDKGSHQEFLCRALLKDTLFGSHFTSSRHFSYSLFSLCVKIKIPSLRTGFHFSLEQVMGLEPTTAAMARRYSSQLSYTCKWKYFNDFPKKSNHSHPHHSIFWVLFIHSSTTSSQEFDPSFQHSDPWMPAWFPPEYSSQKVNNSLLDHQMAPLPSQELLPFVQNEGIYQSPQSRKIQFPHVR